MRHALAWRHVRLAVALLAILVLGVDCADDPAVTPIVSPGVVSFAVRVVDGPLAPPPVAPGVQGAAACEPVPTGFPIAVDVDIVLHSGAGETTTHNYTIPARTESSDLVVGDLPPGSGYSAQLTVTALKEIVFTGHSGAFSLPPGARVEIPIPLYPVGRRAVIAVGAPQFAANEELVIPIIASHSAPVRAIELDLCFDAELLEPLGVAAIGARVAAFRGAGGEPGAPGLYRAVLWSEDGAARIAPGQDQVLEIRFRFRPEAPPALVTDLIFQNAIITDAAVEPPFTAYFFDGQVRR